MAAASPRRGPEGSPFAPAVDYSAAPVLARLPRGRHGLSREFVDLNHRSRLLAGAIDAIADRGYLATTVADVARHAGVSRGAFYRHFNHKQEVFFAAYDTIVDWIGEEIGRALEPDRGFTRGVTAAVATALGIFAADPRLVRYCAMEIFCGGPAGLSRYDETIERLAVPLRAGRDGRAGRDAADELPAVLEETLVGGAISLVVRYVSAGKGERLLELRTDLSEFLLLPYLGIVGARVAAEV